VTAYARITVEPGIVLNARTLAMLKAAESKLGKPLGIIQGSYHAGVSASGGTHDGGGAVDVDAHSSGLHPSAIVLALRRVGFAAWHRLPLPGVWGEHIHMVAIGDKELSPAAVLQVAQYKAGLDGLADHKPDDGPSVDPILTWEQVQPHKGTGKAPTLRPHGANYPGWTRRLQVALNALGGPQLAVDGDYGVETVARVRAFKRNHHIWPATGTCGPRVWKRLGIR
jgi:hypothetical protein